MKFEDLKIILNDFSPQWFGNWGGEFTGVTTDSRKVKEGYIYIPMTGTKSDGHKYIDEAIQRGAKAVVLSYNTPENINTEIAKNLSSLKIPFVKVSDARKVQISLLRKFYNEPHKEIKFIGVTGTNGKTSVCHILWRIFNSANIKTGLVGTIGFMFDDGIYHKIPLTTPSPDDLWKIFREMAENKISVVAMEVSSHALHQQRVWGIDFTYAVFTNLTQDHLDYHGTMDEYLSAKAMLFSSLQATSTAIVNIDDPASSKIISVNRGKLLTYGVKNVKADINVEEYRLSWDGIICSIKSQWGKTEIRSPLIGKFNVYNIAPSFAIAKLEGISDETITYALSSINFVKGRFERINMGQPFAVIVDYAHTPDALKNILQSARQLTSGRVIIVFGAGGDRDQTKRPIMGKIATELADFTIITSDNPRSENPQKIIDMIKEGAVDGKYTTVVDRKEAIYEAMKTAKPNDVVIIAGKGHEDYQILGDKTIRFDDREVAVEALKTLGWNNET